MSRSGSAPVPSGMALQCPTCGHIHSMDGRDAGETFRCAGCRRLLSVPATALPARPTGASAETGSMPTALAPTAAVPRVDGGRAATSPAARQGVAARRAVARKAARLPVWLRMLVWVVALPVGFLVAAVPLRAVGIIDIDYAIDAFADEGAGRFAVLLVVLPLWAAMSATVAHLTLEWAARRRQGRRAAASGPAAAPPGSSRP